MLRHLGTASSSASPRALWLGVITQLRSDASVVMVCSGAASHLGSDIGYACAPLRAVQQLCQRSFCSVFSHDVGGQTEPVSYGVLDSLDTLEEQHLSDAAAAAAISPETRLLQAALVGAPNAGKSSLANALAGRKVAAVSHRTNTTAASRLAAFTDGSGTQVALYDTPGVTSAVRNREHGARVQGAWQLAQHCGLVLFMVDAARQIEKPDPRVTRLAEHLAQRWAAARAMGNAEPPEAMQPPLAPLDGSPESVWDMDTSLYAAPPPGGLVVDAAAIQGSGGDGGGRGNNDNTSGSRKQRGFTAALVLNKVDLVEQQSRLDLINNSLKLVAGDIFDRTFATSALHGSGIDDLREYLFDRASPSAWLPDSIIMGDGPEAHAADLAVELVKEQLFRRLSGELPYELEPVPTESRQLPNGALLLKQTIFVRSESVRAILVGAGGAVIGEVGIRARQSVSRALGCQVHLYLSVVVRKGSSETAQLMAQQGA